MAEGDLLRAGRTLLGMAPRLVFVLAAAGFWATVAGQAIHMDPLWVVISTGLAAATALALSDLISPAWRRESRSGVDGQPVDVDRVDHRDAG
jgi:hypothetical protein